MRILTVLLVAFCIFVAAQTPSEAQWQPSKPGEWRQPALPQPRASFPQPRPVYPTAPRVYPNPHLVYPAAPRPNVPPPLPMVTPAEPGTTVLRSGNQVHIFRPGQKTVTCTTFGSVTRCQ